MYGEIALPFLRFGACCWRVVMTTTLVTPLAHSSTPREKVIVTFTIIIGLLLLFTTAPEWSKWDYLDPDATAKYEQNVATDDIDGATLTRQAAGLGLIVSLAFGASLIVSIAGINLLWRRKQ